MQPCLEGSVRVCISSLTNDDEDHGCEDHHHGCHYAYDYHEGLPILLMSLRFLRAVRLRVLGESVVGRASERLLRIVIDLLSTSVVENEAVYSSIV